MNNKPYPTTQENALAAPMSRRARFVEWLQDPMGSVVAASVATIGSFGVVLSGMWAINVALN
jgi:hypothetical protein